MSKQQREDLPAPPPDYPRSYRKAITEGEYAGSGRIQCTLCGRAIPPEKIDRHEKGESKLHNRKLAERYAKEQQRKRERERKRKLEQEEQEQERAKERQRQIEAERKRNVEALNRELEQQNSIDEAFEISSTSSSSSSSSSDGGSDVQVSSDDDSDVQIVLPPSKPLNDLPEPIEKPKGITRKDDGMWQSQISVLGRSRHIGIFRTPEAAAAAYQAVRNALDESGLPPRDNGRLALFESIRAEANGDSGNMMNASATKSASLATPIRAVEGTTGSPSKHTPKGVIVLSDKHYTGAPGTMKCMETTSRGRPCQFCAVLESRFCNLHRSGLAGRKGKRKRGPVADDWRNTDSSGPTFDTESPRQRKKARRKEPKSDLQEVAAKNLGLTLPMKPKGAINSFMHYRIEQAAEIAASSTSSASSPKVSRIIGEKWHNLSSEEKARYDTMAKKSKEEYEKAYAIYSVALDEFKKAHPEWQSECDRIKKEHTEAALKALDEHIATQSDSPNDSSLGGSSDGHLFSPQNPAPILNISPSRSVGSNEDIMEGLRNGSIRLEPKNWILVENIELVMASREDEERKKSTSTYRRGNVGLRCIHCKDLPRLEQKKQALVFPRDVSCFAGNFSNFRAHFRLCQKIGSKLRAQIESPPDYSSPPKKYIPALSYCQAAAKILGIENDPGGTVRFSIDVPRGEEPTSLLIKPDISTTNPCVPAHKNIPLHTKENWLQRHQTSEQGPSLRCSYCKKSFTTSNGLKYHLEHAVCQKNSEDIAYTNDSILDSEQAVQGAIDADATISDSASLEKAIQEADSSPSDLILPSERFTHVTDVLYVLLNQFSVCNLTRAEQTSGARSHLPIGLAGLQCKHCSKKMFWGGSKEFVKVNEKLSFHVQICTFTPTEKKKAIELAKQLRREQVNKRGLVGIKSHAAFAGRMYERLVSLNSCVDDNGTASANRAPPAHRRMKSDTPSNSFLVNVGVPCRPNRATYCQHSSSSAFWAEVDEADERKEADALFPCSQKRTTTDFNYLVIRQFSLCHRSSQEGRSRYPIGYPGICCIHCQTRMYFADSTSFMKQFSQKVYDHLRRCSRAPRSLSIALAQALERRDDQKQQLGAQGSLTSFCDRVLGKMLKDANIMPVYQASPSTNSRSKKSQGRRAQTSHSHEDTNDEPFVDAPLLMEMDRPLATEHHFDLLSHFGIGELTERAQVANPSLANFPIGQPGLRCRHCKSKTFYYERLANMKSRCVGQLRDHIKKACHSVPEDVRQRFAGDYDHSAMQRQLGNVEGGSLDKMFQRLWLRLYHDFSKRKEIDAISRVTPLLDDCESDDSLFASSSDDDERV